MTKIVSVKEMLAVEKQADQSGVSYAVMMQNAGQGLAKKIVEVYSDPQQKNIFALVGKGNNGGDALVALAHLAQKGWAAAAYIVGQRPEDDLSAALNAAGGEIFSHTNDPDGQILREQLAASIILMDGLLGTGVKLPLRQPISGVLEQVSAILTDMEPRPRIVAVDCPSGIDCDTGQTAEQAVRADLTVCMVAVKQGMLAFPAFEYLGRLELVGIGLPEDFEPLALVAKFLIDDTLIHPWIPVRPLASHKGTFGRALVVAGSERFIGTALLAGQAAFRIGAGWVTLAVPRTVYLALVGGFTEATWLPLPDRGGVVAKEAAALIRENLDRVTALLLGPGLGLAQPTAGFVSDVLGPDLIDSSLPPLVIDADGLKLLVQIEGWQTRIPLNSILTPHPGEMSILTGLPTADLQKDRIETARRFAQEWGQVVVLKGANTVVAEPSGRIGVAPVATPALARAGTGDVLAGMIVGLRAQGVGAFEAAAAGVWLHAQAGLAAAERLGSTAGVLAGDLIEEIPGLLPY